MRTIGSILFALNIVLVLGHWYGLFVVHPMTVIFLFALGLLCSSLHPRTSKT